VVSSARAAVVADTARINAAAAIAFAAILFAHAMTHCPDIDCR